MKQTIPFTKDITFKSQIGELTSISLDNDLTLKGEDLITGNFYISGTYKMLDTVLNPEKYSYKIPVEIAISDEYDTFDSTIDIDDFTYEVEGDTLKIKVVVAIDNLVKKEKEMETDNNEDEDTDDLEDLREDKLNEEEIQEELKKEVDEKIESTSEVENNIDKEDKKKKDRKTFLEKKEELKKEKDNYLTYSVYVVKDEDTITSIKEKYKVTEEEISDYNDISLFKPGMKLVIPSKEIVTND